MYPEPTLVLQGQSQSFPSFLFGGELATANGLLYLSSNFLNESGRALWRTDGTKASERFVELSSVGGFFIKDLTDIKGTLYYQLYNPGDDSSRPVNDEILALLKTNGAVETVVNNLNVAIDLKTVTQVGNANYFIANSRQLWKTDGLLEDAVLVKDLGADAQPQGFLAQGDTLFFTASGGGATAPRQLWKSDGTSAGTNPFTLQSTDNPNGPTSVEYFARADDTIFVTGTNASGSYVWSTNGTAQGTKAIRQFTPGTFSGIPIFLSYAVPNFGVIGDRVVFAEITLDQEIKLWQSDGTLEGTTLLKILKRGVNNPRDPVGRFTKVGDTLFFSTNTEEFGDELWQTDGTPEGTRLVKDITTGNGSSNPRQLTVVNGVLYFVANSDLWASDGTTEGTRLVKDFAGVGQLTNVNGTLYMLANDDFSLNSFVKIWKLETPRSELLARNTDTGEVALLYLDQQNQLQQRSGLTYGANFGPIAGQAANVSIDWKIAATADVDRNGVADLLTYSATKDEVAIWNLGQNAKVDGIRSLVGQNGQILRTRNRDWQVIGMADIDQDKILDVVWHNPVSDEVAFWFMQPDGATVREYDYLRDAAGTVLKTGNPKWRVEAMSDFDSDGDMDLLFRLGELNQTAIVRLNGRVVADAQYLDALPGANLEFRQIAGKQVYWQTANNQQVVIQDLGFRSGKWESTFKPIVSSGQLQGLVDIDGNGSPELIFRNPLTNGLQFALTDPRQTAKPTQQPNQTFQFASGNWAIIQTSDFGNVAAL
jgi:ELWxxDGT repeat protein